MTPNEMERETGRLVHAVKRQSQLVSCLGSRLSRFQEEAYNVAKALENPENVVDRPDAEPPGFALGLPDRIEPLPYPTREEIADTVSEYREAKTKLNALKKELDNHLP